MRTSILIMLLALLPQISLASATHEVNLQINLSEDLLRTHQRTEVEEALRLKLVSAETCINDAFGTAKSDIRLKLNVLPITWLREKEVALLSQSMFTPDRSSEGKVLITQYGNQTQNFILNFYAVPVNHVPFAFTEKNLRLLSTPEIGAFYRELEQNKEPKKPSKQALTAMKSLLPGNLIRINQEELFSPEDGNWNVIPHELMHAVAGYEDNYTDPSNTKPNLMGSYGGGNRCILTPDQVRIFLKARQPTSMGIR